MRRSSGSREIASNLSDSALQQLHQYAISATAAGVGLLALVQPCEARIVYTPAHFVISANTRFDLDLNRDGIADFTIRNVYKPNSQYKLGYLSALPAQRANAVEGVWTYYSGRRPQASALNRGAHIDAAKKFYGKDILTDSIYNFGGIKGFWWSRQEEYGQGKPHYLGLRFRVNGKIHYGWARLRLRENGDKITATLTGYAYETIPGKSIIAGDTRGPTDKRDKQDFGPGASSANPTPGTPQPAPLGVLALGARGASLWRRKGSPDALSEDISF